MPRPLRPPRLEQDRETGIWRVVWFDQERNQTRRRSLETKDAGDAQRRFAVFLLDKDDADARGGRGELTVGAALDLYWKEHVCGTRRDGTPKVIDRARIDVTIRNLGLHFTGTRVLDLTENDIREYSRLRAAGAIGFAQGGQAAPRAVKDGTIRRELQTLVAALHHCTRTGRLSGFDFTKIDVGEPPEPRLRVLTTAEWNRLIIAAPEYSGGRLTRLMRFLMIGLHAPARRRAIEALLWTQVDLKAGIINFNPPGARQSNKRKPTVPIADALRPVLERAFREKTSLYVLDHPGSIRTSFENAVARAGLAGTGVVCHTLRHTYATWALAAGVPIWEVAKMLGDSVATVERNYGHGHPEYLREAANFSQALGG